MAARLRLASMVNILTIDVEEYFHPSEVQRSSKMEDWLFLPSRVEEETDWVLELLARHSTSATFFVLGWVAERHPWLLRRICAAGHEIACHSYAHQLVYALTPDEFRKDTLRAVAAIEDAVGVTPRLYRAPSYSITKDSLWALEILVECGFQCDSSIFPIAHDRYGIPGSDRQAHILETPAGPIWEVPVATAVFSGGASVPVGGGAYLRLLPYRYMAAGIRRINQRERRPACIYFHPWEIDAGQPRLASGLVSRLRTYTGIRGMEKKLERLLTDFRFSTMSSVYAGAPLSRAEPSKAVQAAGGNRVQAFGRG
jgi:polysaccharide deacetylase family protein (PEP-CTERM system associated)